MSLTLACTFLTRAAKFVARTLHRRLYRDLDWSSIDLLGQRNLRHWIQTADGIDGCVIAASLVDKARGTVQQFKLIAVSYGRMGAGVPWEGREFTGGV
jgi:hypothetical protein